MDALTPPAVLSARVLRVLALAHEEASDRITVEDLLRGVVRDGSEWAWLLAVHGVTFGCAQDGRPFSTLVPAGREAMWVLDEESREILAHAEELAAQLRFEASEVGEEPDLGVGVGVLLLAILLRESGAARRRLPEALGDDAALEELIRQVESSLAREERAPRVVRPGRIVRPSPRPVALGHGRPPAPVGAVAPAAARVRSVGMLVLLALLGAVIVVLLAEGVSSAFTGQSLLPFHRHA